MRSLVHLSLFFSLAACAVVPQERSGHAVARNKEKQMHATHLAPDAASFDHTCQADIGAAKKMLSQIEKGAQMAHESDLSLLAHLQEMWRVIDRTANAANLLRNVHPDAEIREKADSCEREVSQLTTEIGMSQALYKRLGRLDVSKEDAQTQRWVTHLLRDLRRAGVDQTESTRVRIRAIKDRLVSVGQDFERNIREHDATLKLPASSLKGLPSDYISAHPVDASGQVEISCDYPDYLPLMTYAEDDDARQKLYTLFRQRGAPKNDAVLHEMLTLREELATLLRHPNWAAYITEDKMIGSAEHAEQFINDIAKRAKARAGRDYQELLAARQRDVPEAKEVADWQKGYYEEQVRQTRYKVDAQAVRQFFPFGRVRQGIFDVTGKLFGVTFARIPAPVWHPSVEAYELRDGGKAIGRFFLDLHPRADKYKHAAAFPLVAGIAGVQLPESALVCNFPAGEDALLEHNDVETFFHEFGHLLHHLFAGHVRWIEQSGIATEWDFVEAPSQMLEEWAFDKETLQHFAKRQDGQVIDDATIASMRRARDFGKGLWVSQQMFYAALSLGLHKEPTKTLQIASYAQSLQARYSPFAYVPNTRFELSFGHLEGYSAIYYTYMWSLVIAKDLVDAFLVPPGKGLSDSQVAARYRQAILAPGGTQDAAKPVEQFLGRPFSPNAFARWLHQD